MKTFRELYHQAVTLALGNDLDTLPSMGILIPSSWIACCTRKSIPW